MAFDSLKNIQSFLLIVIVTTVFVLFSMVWSVSYLKNVVRIPTGTNNKDVYKTGSNNKDVYKRDELKESIKTIGVMSRSKTPTKAQSINQKRGLILNMSQSTKGLNTTQSNNRTGVTTKIRPTNRPDICTNCFQHNFEYIIQNEAVCNKSINSSAVDLIVLIFTVHGNFKHREVIRKTWLSVTRRNKGSIRHVFLLGYSSDRELSRKVELENDVYHDIIKESFVDSYKNLTHKTIMGFKWVKTFCANARFVMKTDDDMYVNLPAILKVLEKEQTSLQTSVSGSCALKAEPIRDKSSKWFASVRNYPNKSYPGFCSGTGYVTSLNVAVKVYEVSPNVPFFYLEDIYVALCVKKLGFTLRHIAGFHNYRTKLDPCEMKSDRILTSHTIPLDFLIKIRDAHCK